MDLSPARRRTRPTRIKRIRLMSVNFDIEVEVSGKEHKGKTTLVAYLTRILTEAGAELIVQRADPQIDEKLGLTDEALKEKLTGKKIFLRETQTIL